MDLSHLPADTLVAYDSAGHPVELVGEHLQSLSGGTAAVAEHFRRQGLAAGSPAGPGTAPMSALDELRIAIVKSNLIREHRREVTAGAAAFMRGWT